MAAIMSSCHRSLIDKKLIIGDWNFSKEKNLTAHSVKILPPFSGITNNLGFDFINDSICLYKPGYFKRSGSGYHGTTTFLGFKTKYAIDDSLLKVWNLEELKWDFFNIQLNTKDTLVIKGDNIRDYFVRPKYQLTQSSVYDELIVTSSGCFGSCPTNRILLKNTGDVVYYGKDYNTINGLFSSYISKNEFNDIEKKFVIADYIKLENFYHAGWTDDNTINLTFVKNGRVIKQIEDYGRQSPPALQYAYNSVLYLYQHLKLQPIAHDTVNNVLYNYMIFENKEHKVYQFRRSECFYLETLLLSSSTVNKKFITKYKVVFNDWDQNNKEQILTDGQLFKFVANNGKSTTYDLGYNYFDRNGLNSKFVEKNKY